MTTIEDEVRAILPNPSIPRMQWDWNHMERQVSKVGPPGITWERCEGIVGMGHLPDRDVPIVAVRDVVTYRNSRGRLVGILVRWPEHVGFGGTTLEKAGAMSIWTAPNRWHRGIGTKLLAWADERWGIDWNAQLLTEQGWRLCAKYLIAKLTEERATRIGEALEEVRHGGEMDVNVDDVMASVGPEPIGPCPNCAADRTVVLAVNSAYQPSDPIVVCGWCGWEGRRSVIVGAASGEAV